MPGAQVERSTAPFRWTIRALALVLAVAFPAGHLYLSWDRVAASAQMEADILAELLTRHANANPDLWVYERPRLEHTLGRQFGRAPAAKRLVDSDGRELAEFGGAPAPPRLTRRAVVYDAGRQTAQVTVARSLRPILGETLVAALAGLLLAFAVYWTLEALPLRALRRSLAERDEARQQASDSRLELEVAKLSREFADREKELLHKAVEAAEESSRAKSRFLANMSHDMRTPMNGVLGTLDLLRRTNLSGEQERLLDTAWGSGQTLLALLADILDLSKVEAGKLELESIAFPLHRALAEVVHLFSAEAERKGIALVYAVAPDVPKTVQGDPLRLRQILANLCSNALKFTERGRIDLSVSRASAAGDSPLLRFEVADTGIGMAPGAAQRIFKAFTQEDSSTTRRYGGTGLGLAISSHLVNLMGGEIGVESQHGQGSRFWFTAPLPSAAAGAEPVEEPTGTAEAPPAVTPLKRPVQVLLVEDNAVNQAVTLAMLQATGASAALAQDGQEAVTAAAATRYDLILMDCQMPVMDGLQATAEIRRLEADRGLRRTPIVALTGTVLDKDREDCLAAGMDDFLSKPFRLHELAAVVRRWCESPDSAGSSGHSAASGPPIQSVSSDQPLKSDESGRE